MFGIEYLMGSINVFGISFSYDLIGLSLSSYWPLIALLVIIAFVAELIDSGLGMMYGTLVAASVILLGFNPVLGVPSILISQAMGGLTGAAFHHKLSNADFGLNTKDSKIVLIIVLPGLLAVLVGVYIGLNISIWALKSYIAVLVVFMGFFCLFPLRYRFDWRKMFMVSVVAAFNKAISAEGFGPIVSTGNILGGLGTRRAVAVTTYSEAIICTVSFLAWNFMGGRVLELWFPLTICIGAVVGATIGPRITEKLKPHWLKIAVGILAIVSGIYLCYTVITALNNDFLRIIADILQSLARLVI
ncbi:MAG: sulfite exporter TauE/SafE family protein [Candidatus Jordarchaeum sp.]|uniref:sulfite exporter TauE/SafE family protein n=1 Tax=Candidatus Jordarchaeum sp. TaxID=2823881 RepID=UPI00404A7DB1